MKPHGSSINKPGSKYSPGPIIYNRSLFKTGATMLHPFVRIQVINNRSPIMHNRWEWVIYNRRKRVPFSPPFFGFRLFFVLNIPILSSIIDNRTHWLFIIGTLILNNLCNVPIIYNQEITHLNYLKSMSRL